MTGKLPAVIVKINETVKQIRLNLWEAVAEEGSSR